MNPERRLWGQNTGYDENCYSYSRRPVELKYFEIFNDVNQATARKNKLRVGLEKETSVGCSEL